MPVSAHANPAAEAVLMQQYLYFQKISTLELVATERLILGKAVSDKLGVPGYNLASTTSFLSQGSKYYCKCDQVGNDNKIFSTIWAYNGDVYQTLPVENVLELTVTRNYSQASLFSGTHPLGGVFSFAFSLGDNITIETLCQSSKWSDLTKKVIDAQEVSMFGKEGTLLTFNNTTILGKEARIEVFFASCLNHFPIYFKRTTSNMITEVRVVQTKELNDGLVFPLLIEGRAFYKDGTLVQEENIMVDEGSLKINHYIDDKIFTIPFDQVHIYHDIDSNIFLKNKNLSQ